MTRCRLIMLTLAAVIHFQMSARAAEPAPPPALPPALPSTAGVNAATTTPADSCVADPYLGSGHGKRLGGMFAKHDPACKPEGCAYSHLFCPLEVYLRTGPALIVNGGTWSDVLDTGYAVEGGAKGFWYDEGNFAAWTGSLGLEFVYNNAAFNSGLTLISEPVTLRDMYRMSVSSSVGREWYFGSGEPGALRGLVGFDVGGRLGHAHANFIGRTHQTDAMFGVFVGLDAGVMIPKCGYDIVLGGRFEWGHQWFEVVDQTDNLGEIKLLLTAGLRY